MPGKPARVEQGLRVCGGDAQQYARRTLGCAPALFPVLQGADTDAKKGCKFRLAELELLAEGSDVRYAVTEQVSGSGSP